jgi:hypothetical protein
LIRIEKTTPLARICFCGLDRKAMDQIAGLPSPRDAAVARLLNVQLIVDKEKCEICIILP